MQPAQLEALRPSLEKASHLFRPRRAALEAFTGGLAQLLAAARGQQNQAQVKAYLLAMLPATCFVPEDQQNSSPVCYAQIPGLREGFEDPGVPTPPANRLTGNTASIEALHAVRDSIRQLLYTAPVSLPAGTALEKQIAALVSQLCQLSPAEIADFERS